MRLANTEVHLLQGVPFSKDLSHTLHFASKAEQRDYFLGKSAYTATNLTYQREGGFIRWKTDTTNVDDIMSCNYVMYRNINNGNKWLYAFVTEVEYINENTVNVHLETDYYQSYILDVDVKPSLLERKHLKKPNIQAEGLDYGDEYLEVDSKRLGSKVDSDTSFALITTSIRLSNPTVIYNGTISGGVPTPFQFYLVPINRTWQKIYTVNGSPIKDIQLVMGQIALKEEWVDKIVSINILKEVPFPYTLSGTNPINIQSTYLEVGDSQVPRIKSHDTNVRTNNIDLNIPNQGSKLAMSPYTYIEIYDAKGSSIKLKPEYLLTPGRVTINERTIISYDPKTLFTVNGYAGLDEFSVTLETSINADIPVVTDQTAAFMQSSRNSRTTVLKSAAAGALSGGIGGFTTAGPVGAATGAIIGGVGGGLAFAFANNRMMKDLENKPNKVSSALPNTIFDFAHTEMQGAYVRVMTISPDKQKQIGDFFHKFGYAVNEIGSPLSRNRQDFQYIKTVDCIARGNVPNKALESIKEQFNNGFTLWYNKDIGNYILTNGVI